MLILLIHGLCVDEEESHPSASKWQDGEVCPEAEAIVCPWDIFM